MSDIGILEDSPNAHQALRFMNAWIALCLDSPLDTSTNYKPMRVLRKFRNKLLNTDLLELIDWYSGLADHIMTTCTLYGSGSVTGLFHEPFKNTPVFKEYLHWFKTGDPLCLQFVLTFCRFGKKLPWLNDDLIPNAFRDWEEVEEKLSNLVFDDDILADIRVIIASCLPFEMQRMAQPKFGPRHVAEAGIFGYIAKTRNFSYDALLDYAFFKSSFITEDMKEEYGYNPSSFLPKEGGWRKKDGVSQRHSRLAFVPKDIRKARTICMEPNTYMYFQQFLLEILRSSISEGEFSSMIDLTDQTNNQRGALYGSYTGNVDTIDLSSASDSVSWDLVKKVFPRKLLFFLSATRTRRVELQDGSIREVNKFAPMGSALCFPVQCILFAAINIAAIHRHHSRISGDPLSLPQLSQVEVKAYISKLLAAKRRNGYGYRTPIVYGDDIVCDSRVTSDVVHLLHSLGFQVNEGKSFVASNAFRESCGKYYWNGEDVTPFLFKVKRSGRKLSPESLASMIAACNNSGDWGYFHLRSNLIRTSLYSPIEQVRGQPAPILFTEDRERFGIYTLDARNAHLKSRQFPDDIVEAKALTSRYESVPDDLKPNYVRFQRDEVLAIRLRSRRIEIDQNNDFDQYVWLRWWATHHDAGDDINDFVDAASREVSRGLRIKLGWTPT